jgi:hypothetical protein
MYSALAYEETMTQAAKSPTPVEDPLARARAYVTHSHAKNTLDAYAADWKYFSAWCDDHKRRALPASPETILYSIVDLVDRYTVATIDRRLSSIGYYTVNGHGFAFRGMIEALHLLDESHERHTLCCVLPFQNRILSTCGMNAIIIRIRAFR